MAPDLAIIAGTISTVVFAVSMLPMLGKALRTRDLSSYSLGNLSLANLGNLVHSVYVFSLPAGPIWALHTFYLITSGVMFVLYLAQRSPAPPERTSHVHPDPEPALSL